MNVKKFDSTISFLKFPIFYHITVTMLSMSLIFIALIYSDLIDAIFSLVQMLFVIFLYELMSKKYSTSLFHKNLSRVILLFSIIAASINMMNKINGFPDKELFSLLIIFLEFILILLTILFLIIYHNKLSILLFIFLMIIIVSPVLRIAPHVVRQIVAHKLIKTSTQNNVEVQYFTKINFDYIFAFGQLSPSEQKELSKWPVIMVYAFNKKINMYTLDKTIWLPDGKGSMDTQYPNEYKWMIKFYEFTLFLFNNPKD